MARHCIFTDIIAILQNTASDPAFANHFAFNGCLRIAVRIPFRRKLNGNGPK